MKFDTIQVHAGFHGDKETHSVAVPIYQTTAYTFDTAQQAADLFALKEFGNIYARMNNPTCSVFEERIAALEGGVGALALSSGQSASTIAVLNIAALGDNIVLANTVYGGTYNLFVHTFEKLGIEARLVDADDFDAVRAAIDDKTKCVFAETIGNPAGNVTDISKLAEIAHENGIPLMIDNTFATPYLCQPIAFGADIVLHSATKFLGGHGNSMAGVIIDSGKFDWAKSGKFPGLTEPDASYHDIRYCESFGSSAYIIKARVQLLRDLGCCLSPFNAFMLLNGIETLSLRMEKHTENAKQAAIYLKNHPAVAWVKYAGFPEDPYYKNAQRYVPKGPGSVFSIGLKGGYDACIRALEKVKLFYHVTNVGDVRSIITHPASTTHAQLTAAQRAETGIADEMLRLSIGIEDITDILEDLEQAFS